jgi:hypothetical protein
MSANTWQVQVLASMPTRLEAARLKGILVAELDFDVCAHLPEEGRDLGMNPDKHDSRDAIMMWTSTRRLKAPNKANVNSAQSLAMFKIGFRINFIRFCDHIKLVV